MRLEQIMPFNAPFLNYEGVLRGTNVRQLIDKVNSHNREYISKEDYQILINNVQPGEDGEISVTDIKIPNNLNSYIKPNNIEIGSLKYDYKNIKADEKYYVRMHYDEEGFVRCIWITDDYQTELEKYNKKENKYTIPLIVITVVAWLGFLIYLFKMKTEKNSKNKQKSNF